MAKEARAFTGEINIQEKGTHQFGDRCPVFIDLGTFKGLAQASHIFLKSKLPRTPVFEGLGLNGLLYPFDSILAQREIRKYINSTGTEQVSVADFEAPNVFDPDKFNPNTIIRLTPDISVRADFAYYDSTLAPQYCHRHRVYSEYPRGWQNLDVPAPKIPQSYIGIVRKFPGLEDHIFTYFENDQPKLLSRLVKPFFGGSPIDLGAETHVIIAGQLFRKLGISLDMIVSAGKVEVLMVGKGSKKYSRSLQEKPARIARAFSPSPV